MDERLVQDCNLILSTLIGKSMGINDLKRETGLSNNAFHDGKDYLKLATFIKTDAHPKHKQKIIVSLTESGQYFAKLIVNFGKFKEHLKKFNDEIKNFIKYTYMDEKVRINIMHSEQWNENEIENYPSNVTGVYELKSNFLGIMSNVIENIYVTLLLKFNPNKAAKDYIIKVISDIIAYYLQNKFDKIIDNDGSDYSKKYEENYYNISERLFEIIDDYVLSLLHHRMISNNVKNLTYTVFDLIDFPKEYIKQRISEAKSTQYNPDESVQLMMDSFLDSLLRRL